MTQLILMRHGQSLWNQRNLFTGWVDIPLSELGVAEALQAGRQLQHTPIDVLFTSSLIRAQMTLMLVMQNHVSDKPLQIVHPENSKLQEWGKSYGPEGLTLPVHCAWELNERMYGKLQGLNKAETMEKYGEKQVKLWRRSYDVPPPDGESLQMTAARAIPYFKRQILPQLEKGLTVLVVAHGNSLRSIIMDIEGMSKEQILEFELPTGVPRIYDFERGSLRFKS